MESAAALVSRAYGSTVGLADDDVCSVQVLQVQRQPQIQYSMRCFAASPIYVLALCTDNLGLLIYWLQFPLITTQICT